MKSTVAFTKFYVKPKIPNEIKILEEIAYNIWSTWDIDAGKLFRRISPKLYSKYNHNPVKLLQTVSKKRLEELSKNLGFVNEMKSVYKKFNNYINFKNKYSSEMKTKYGITNKNSIAYFSMEYGLHESLPIYSGGLGLLSGEHIKSASDLGFPLVAFGLLYHYGYFNQKIDLNGEQRAIYTENDWPSLPIKAVKDEKGDNLKLKIVIKNEEIYLKAWKIEVGKVPLYLLDCNCEENSESHRSITSYLYVSDIKTRILQEIVLTFGAFELMNKLNIKPDVYHLNEGHSAFLAIRRFQKLINEKNYSFEEAKEIIRASTVFTTHTPVPAGNESFPMNLIEELLKDKVESFNKDFYWFSQFSKIKNSDKFSMPAFAIRFSKFINGVSKLHGEVSREMWKEIFPKLYKKEVPIDYVTNGVHTQSWLSIYLTRLFDRYIGPEYRHMPEVSSVWKNVMDIPNHELWRAHMLRKEETVSFIRKRMKRSLIQEGGNAPGEIGVLNVLNPANLTIGFARRFATYKRGDLILNNPERLLSLLNHKKRPIQFVFAGKAHPADKEGQAVIKKIIDFARANDVEDKFIFIENYDINIARHLVQGVDVWLNNPIKPLEASGTSGMKAGMNGVLNLSVLDGWWPECYNGKNGWSITAGEGIDNPKYRDILEANEIYDLLEYQIAPLYYDRNSKNLPLEWVKRMKNSIVTVGNNFNIHKMLKGYIDKFYYPSIEFSMDLQKDDKLKKIVDFEKELHANWHLINFSDVELDLSDRKDLRSGDFLEISAKIELNNAPSELIQVEAFYKPNNKIFHKIKLDLKEKNSDIAEFYGKIEIKSAGEQEINLRIIPNKICEKKVFKDFVKWYI